MANVRWGAQRSFQLEPPDRSPRRLACRPRPLGVRAKLHAVSHVKAAKRRGGFVVNVVDGSVSAKSR